MTRYGMIKMHIFPGRFSFLAAIIVVLFAALTLACGAASTATPSPATSVPSPTKAQPVPSTARPTPPTPVPTQTPGQPAERIGSVFIQLTDPLDEPQFYCVDVPGAGKAVRLNSPLQAHTCKPLETAEDELFAFDHPNDGQIYMEAYDLCVEATGTAAGSTVGLKPCSDSPNQRFIVDDDTIRLATGDQSDLCFAVDADDGIPTGGPSHLRRDLTLENCEQIGAELSSWIFGIFDY